MANKMIFQCKLCNENYCGECSTNADWQNFCSTECEYLHETQDLE